MTQWLNTNWMFTIASDGRTYVKEEFSGSQWVFKSPGHFFEVMYHADLRGVAIDVSIADLGGTHGEKITKPKIMTMHDVKRLRSGASADTHLARFERANDGGKERVIDAVCPHCGAVGGVPCFQRDRS